MIIRKREETKPVKVDAEARADQEHKTRAGRGTEWEADEATAATPTATGDTPKNERATTMKETTKTSRLAGQLEKLYNKLNADFFNGELEPPIITIQSSPRTYGHYTLYSAWSVKGQERREINIAAGTLDRPIENVTATLLHEMCHQYNAEVLHAQDCSGSSKAYHNKVFKAAAEAHGLIVSRSDKYGWSHTEPGDKLIEWLIKNDVQEIMMSRNDVTGPRIGGSGNAANGGTKTSGATKGHYRRYICPVCGMIARTTKDARLICGDCLAPMTEN